MYKTENDLYSIEEITVNSGDTFTGKTEYDSEIAILSGTGWLDSYASRGFVVQGMFRNFPRDVEWTIGNEKDDPLVFLLTQLKGESDEQTVLRQQEQ